jgi:hypothetical protein
MRKNRQAWRPFTVLLVLALTACSTQKAVNTPLTDEHSETKVRSQDACNAGTPAEDWIRAFVLPPSLREEALNAVKTPVNDKQVWLRTLLLTHSEASYRELREAESLLLNQLKLSDTESIKCEHNVLLDYILKLNQLLQNRKSEVVLLQRQLNEQNKTNETLVDQNDALQRKIEALTNIEHRMKQRSKKVHEETGT